MENLPYEVLETIISFCESAKDKASLCLVKRSFNSKVTPLLYQDIMITGPRNYSSLKETLLKHEGSFKDQVRSLDFSSYTTRGSRWSEEKARRLLDPEEFNVLVNGSHLKHLLIGEVMIDAFYSPSLMNAIFHCDSQLETLELTGFDDTQRGQQAVSFHHISRALKNVSFFRCVGLSQERFFAPFFEKLDAQGNELKKLDMSYTRINAQLFDRMKHIRTLTHLNLQGCHSLTCCSPLISFIEQNASTLVELNLNLKHSNFCTGCLSRILSCLNHQKLRSLNLSGHRKLDDTLVQSHLEASFPQLRFLSLHYTPLSLPVLQRWIQSMPSLFYLHLHDPIVMSFISQTANHTVQVVETSLSKLYPSSILYSKYKLVKHESRSYLTRNNVEPSYVYSKKLNLMDTLSPMNRYYSYSI